MPLLRIIFTFIATSLITGFGYGAASVATLPASVKRVVILGDSITYAGTYVTYLEAYFRTRHPERNLEFINVGLPSETVSGLSEPDHAKGQFPRPVLKERLHRVLEATRPDYVIACYGMNDGIYLPFTTERFQAFQAGILELKKSVEQRGSGFLLVTPPNYDAKGDSANSYNEVLARYGAWQLEQRKLGWQVVDLNGPMTEELASRRKTNP
ncbi:MAG TPA: SGNH/GDSL hydrolase family protein, partial [Opitutaceae bacterium]|nr:SGNH/GDSL hydrolase family protein [Opitutaceae bacterium]